MSQKSSEILLNVMGDIDERYIQEYIEAGSKTPKTKHIKVRFALIAAAVLVMLFGTVSIGAVPVIAHFLTNWANEKQVVIQNFDEVEARYAIRINDTQKCNGVTASLNSAVVEDHYLLLSYTFDWGNLKEAQDGSFHTWFLPWYFYITEGDTVICKSEYTKGLHTQIYLGDAEESPTEATHLYCIDLEGIEGKELIGKELTVRLLYSEDGEGFVSAFTPVDCFTDKDWHIGRIYEFGEHKIVLDRVQESALWVTLFIDCDTIGHNEDEYRFMLSDELGNDYDAYPNEDNDKNGYWFTKPRNIGGQLTLKVIRSQTPSGSVGGTANDSYEVIGEFPIQ